MRVLVAGGTGALGVPTVRRLIAHGHDVASLTRSPAKRAQIEELGARAIVADVMDRDALAVAVKEAAPEGVIHALTALPKNGPLRPKHLEATNRLRVTGTANLIEASVAAGTRRMVAESIILAYGLGDLGCVPITEDHPLVQQAPAKSLQPALDAILSLEQQVLGATGIEGIVLRYGLFYGPGTGTTDFMVRMMKRRLVPIPGDGKAVGSWIHIEDAAEATVLALEKGRPKEAYNVVDDEPVSAEAYLTETARAIGAKPPRHFPVWLIRPFAPYVAVGARSQLPVSNEKAKRDLGWTLEYPTYREGARSLATG